jgi:hypothetical protein
MNKEVADKWVAALRSGNYKQGTGELKNGKGEFCCLGVLLDINGFKSKKTQDARNTFGDNSYGAIVDLDIRKKCGIRSAHGEFVGDDGEATFLTRLNDSGKTFNQIADIIEKHWEAL